MNCLLYQNWSASELATHLDHLYFDIVFVTKEKVFITDLAENILVDETKLEISNLECLYAYIKKIYPSKRIILISNKSNSEMVLKDYVLNKDETSDNYEKVYFQYVELVRYNDLQEL